MMKCPKCESDRSFVHSGIICISAGRASKIRENVDIECAECGFRGEVEYDPTEQRIGEE